MNYRKAIQTRIRWTNAYIKQMIMESDRPLIGHLQQIKDEFKTNGDAIARINATFNLVLSAFFAVILIGILRDSIYLFWSIFAYSSMRRAAMKGTEFFQTDLMREMVRCISSDVIVISMKFSLIGLTVMQMISVNHDSRSTPVLVNDLFSQFNHAMQPDLYRSVRLRHTFAALTCMMKIIHIMPTNHTLDSICLTS